MRVPVLLLLVLLLPACALFKNTKTENLTESLQLEEVAIQVQREVLQTEDTEKIHLQLEMTAAQRRQVEIWPKGKFTFSPERGFEGEAEKIRLQQADDQTTVAVLQLAEQRQVQAIKEQVQGVKTDLDLQRKQKLKATQPAWTLVSGIALLLIFLALAWRLQK